MCLILSDDYTTTEVERLRHTRETSIKLRWRSGRQIVAHDFQIARFKFSRYVTILLFSFHDIFVAALTAPHRRNMMDRQLARQIRGFSKINL